MNSNEPNSAIYQVEEKLRYLTGDYSLCKIFAIYDCCRVPIENMKGLHKIYGAKGHEIETKTNAANYTHIQACGPGGVAEADGGFAQKFYEFAE